MILIGPRHRAGILYEMVKNELRILMVEDNDDDRVLLERELNRAGLNFSIVHVEEREQFIVELNKNWADIILCDFSLPRFSAIEALEVAARYSPDTPVLIVTGTLTDETAVECLKKGAVDYVLKEKILRLPSAIKNALDLQRSKKEKALAEQNLKQYQKQLEVITNVLPALFAYITTDYMFQFCNRTYVDWFNKSESEIVGKPIVEILGSRIFDYMKSKEGEILKGERLIFENTLATSRGELFVTVTLVPDFDKTAQAAKGYVCLITDMSERKRYENQLKAAKEEADSANRAKSQFLANISHEMRTPLNAIMGLSELLLSDKLPPEEKISLTERVAKNSEHLRKMIDEVLDLSAVEAGKLKINQSRFSIIQTVAQVKSLLYPMAKEKQIDLNFTVEGRVPEFAFSDPEKLKQILINIVGNAIKFSDSGEVRIQIKMLSNGGHPKLAFIVSDHGRGMTQEHVQHLFEPFTQVDGSFTRRFGGTGLGLTLARKFARALGGNVELMGSVLGKGSVFAITIDPGVIANCPLIKDLNNTFEESDALVKTSKISLKSIKVLVVEDAPENQFLIRRFLEIAGAEVDLACDGQIGVQTALSKNFDLVLMDIQMPVLDGYQATARLRMKGYDRPIVALTAHALAEEKDRCLKNGFDGFLTKPIHREELLTQVSKYRVKA